MMVFPTKYIFLCKQKEQMACHNYVKQAVVRQTVQNTEVTELLLFAWTSTAKSHSVMKK